MRTTKKKLPLVIHINIYLYSSFKNTNLQCQLTNKQKTRAIETL